MLTKTEMKDLVYKVLGLIIDIHKALGPGLLESVYHTCLKYELTLQRFNYKTELIVPVQYKGVDVNADLRCDLLIEDSLVLELKAVNAIVPVHKAQLLTYMKLLKAPQGLLINFNVANIVSEGQLSMVNEYYSQLPN